MHLTPLQRVVRQHRMLPSEGAEVARHRVPSRHRVEQASVHARTKLPFQPKPV